MTELKADEQEVARGEAQAVLAVAADPDYRAELASLVAAADEGSLDEDEARTLERVLELGLQAGRIRAIYGPGGEQAALRLYRRLPRGAELSASARSVSEALDGLSGRTLESIALKAVGPGSYTLDVAVDGTTLSIRLDRQGARVGSVAT